MADTKVKNKSRTTHFVEGFTKGDFRKIQLMTGLHYETVRKTLVYGRKNTKVLEAAAKVRAFNQSLKIV